MAALWTFQVLPSVGGSWEIILNYSRSIQDQKYIRVIFYGLICLRIDAIRRAALGFS